MWKVGKKKNLKQPQLKSHDLLDLIHIFVVHYVFLHVENQCHVYDQSILYDHTRPMVKLLRFQVIGTELLTFRHF